MLASWRETLQPSSEAWWWSLEERAAAPLERSGFGWQLLGGLLVTVSISLSVDISQRFLQALTRARFPPPYHWAAFVLTGDPD